MAKKLWQESEKKGAKLFGNKRTPRSGGLWFAKGDSKGEKFLMENKNTSKENFTIQGKVWEKIEHEAIIEGRIPVLYIDFEVKKKVLVVFSLEDFLTMI